MPNEPLRLEKFEILILNFALSFDDGYSEASMTEAF